METVIIENACSPKLLHIMKTYAEDPHWDFPPANVKEIEHRFAKLRLINKEPVNETGVLAGMALGLFVQMDEAVQATHPGLFDEWKVVISRLVLRTPTPGIISH